MIPVCDGLVYCLYVSDQSACFPVFQVMFHLCSCVHSNCPCVSDAWEPVESASDMVLPCGPFHNAVT